MKPDDLAQIVLRMDHLIASIARGNQRTVVFREVHELVCLQSNVCQAFNGGVLGHRVEVALKSTTVRAQYNLSKQNAAQHNQG